MTAAKMSPFTESLPPFKEFGLKSLLNNFAQNEGAQHFRMRKCGSNLVPAFIKSHINISKLLN